MPWWGWMLAGVAVQDVAAVGLMWRMGYQVDWDAVTRWREGRG